MARPNSGPWVNFNERDGYRTERDKKALQRWIDAETDPGHWLWLGRLNHWGTPVRRVGTDFVAAVDLVYSTWKRHHKPPMAVRVCDRPLCVRPGCWVVPVSSKVTRSKSVPVADGRKQECSRGHDLSIWRRKSPSGWIHCGACEKVKSKLRQERRVAAKGS